MGAVAIALILVMRLTPSTQPVLGSAPSGLPAKVATSSTLRIAANNLRGQLLFSTSTNCSARIITTGTSSIFLDFGFSGGNLAADPHATTSELSGIFQAASTTVVYDGGLYGCDPVKLNASDNALTGAIGSVIHIMETQ